VEGIMRDASFVILLFATLSAALTTGLAQGQAPSGAPFRIEKLDPGLDASIAPDAKLKTLGDRFALTEGPVWVDGATPQDGYLLFRDNAANVIYKWAPNQPLTAFLEKSSFTGTDNIKVEAQTVAGRVGIVPIGSNGLALDPQRRLIVTAMNDRTVYHLEKDGTRTILADRYDGKRFSGPNDIVVTSNGAVYFTDTPWGLRDAEKDPQRELPFYGFYLVKDGKVTLLGSDKNAHGGIPNGITLSPDEEYFVRHFRRTPDETVRHPA
jgi:gluconolactonase